MTMLIKRGNHQPREMECDTTNPCVGDIIQVKPIGGAITTYDSVRVLDSYKVANDRYVYHVEACAG